jgi:hypothetical protein
MFLVRSRTTFATKFVRDLNATWQQWEMAGEAA